MFYTVLFYFMPKPENIDFLGHGFWIIYRPFYESIKIRVMSYHKEKLCELDYDFKMELVNKELVRRRKIAIENGIDFLDKRYPDIISVLNPNKRKTH